VLDVMPEVTGGVSWDAKEEDETEDARAAPRISVTSPVNHFTSSHTAPINPIGVPQPNESMWWTIRK
jgi:hypothetical protein